MATLHEYLAFETFRLHAFAAWWQACHQHAIHCAEHGASPDEIWPLEQGAWEYDEAIQTFRGFEILNLPPDARATAMALLPAHLHHYVTDKTVHLP